MYTRILIPTDGGACSGEVIAHGVAIARAMGSSVVFLFVMDGMSSRREGVVTVADAVRTLSVHGQAVLQRAKMTATAAGVPADGELVEGSPADVIVERSVDFDLVVMGSHGRGLLRARARLRHTRRPAPSRAPDARRPVFSRQDWARLRMLL